jgi:hypothetical protein
MSKLYNIAKKAFFEPIKKNLNPGKAIKSVKTNVPDTETKKLASRLKVLEQKSKAAKSMLDQTNFEIANPKFAGGKFTFDPGRKNVTKESVKKRNEESKKIFEQAEGKAKGGRIGYRLGSPKKSKLKKIQEAFKTTPSFMVKKDKPKKRLMAKKGSPDPKKKKKKKFPDLTGDGKVTFADILKGRGVINGKKKTKKKII